MGVLRSANRRALTAVAKELLYCGAIYSAMAYTAKPQKQAELLLLSTSFSGTAASVLPDDPDFLKRETEFAAHRVADEVVGASPEKHFSLKQLQTCTTYLEEGAIANAIRNKSVEVSQ